MIYARMNNVYFLMRIRNLSFHRIFFVLVFSTFFSCTGLKNIGIEVAVQPEYPITDDVQSLVLLNRSMTGRFTNINADTLQKLLIKSNMVVDTFFQDSIAADTAIQAAAKDLFDSGRFDVVIPTEPNIVRTDDAEVVNPLNSGFIREMCANFKVDAVLVLESFAERISTKYFLTTNDNSIKEYTAATDVTYLSDWRLYRPDNKRPVIRFQVGDTIFWKNGSYSLEDVYRQMPRTKEALIEGGIAAGLKMSGYISPDWISQNRYYYETGKSEIDAAIPLIKENKWEEAAQVWGKYASTSSQTIKSKVEYNLALAAEMNGDLDLALDWGLKSFKTKYTKAIEVYLKTLNAKKIAQQKENLKRY